MADIDIKEDEDLSDQDSTHKSRNDESKREVCRNFLKNRCNRGASCKYEHPKSALRGNRSRSRSPVSSKGDGNKDICRDFLRNLCKRGDHCRFYHPPREDGEGKKAWFTLCLDYQNGKCTRHDCRYFHVSIIDEEQFRAAGEISPHIIDQAMAKATNLDIAFGGTKPTCKDFLRGYCKLRVCRFRHVDLCDYEDEIYKALFHELEKLLGPPAGPGRGPFDYPPRRRMPPYGEGFGPGPYEEYGRERPVHFARDMPEDFAREAPMPPPMRRSFYGPGDGYDMPMRPPLEAPVPWDDHGVRPPFREESERPFDYTDTEKEIVLLRRELKQLREHALYNQQGKIDQSSFDEIKVSNDKFIRENSELHDSVRVLQRENEKLTNDVRNMESWATKNDEVQLQIEKYQRENQELKDQLNKQKAQMYTMQTEQQTFDRHRTYMQEQARKLQNQMLVVENELAKSWGGGPPTVPTLREAWALLKSTCNFLVKNSLMSAGGEETSYMGGGTNGTDSIGSGFGRPNYNTGSMGFEVASSAPLTRGFDAPYEGYEGQGYRNFSRR